MALMLFVQQAMNRVFQPGGAAQAADSLAQAVPDSVAVDSAQGAPLVELIETPSRFMQYLGKVVSLEQILVDGFKVIFIILLSWAVIKLVDRSLRMWNRRFEDLPNISPRRQRALTISTLLSSVVRYTVGGIALITILGVLHIDVAALVATAGIAGIAIGFGAQSLVKDFIGGMLLLFDDTIHVGDLIRVGVEEGTVEEIGIRTIKIRRFNGELLMVPAGDLRTFGNRSIDFVRAIVPVGLSYDQDVNRIMAVMQQVADAYANDHRDILLDEEPIVQAITMFSESSVDARIVVKLRPGEQFEAERELRRRVKEAFDEQGITIPFPQRTLHVVSDQEAAGPFGARRGGRPALPEASSADGPDDEDPEVGRS
jgi:small-conductance mechanosensitive channel